MAAAAPTRGPALRWAPSIPRHHTGWPTLGLLGEWRWPLAATALLVLLIDLPYRIAQLGTGHGQLFVGMLWAPHDAAQYLSAMRQGAASGWLVYDRFSQEPHAPALIYLFYVLLGKLAALLGTPFEEAFVTAGTLARAALFLAIYGFARAVTDDMIQRRLILVVVPTVSGLASCLGVAATLTGLTLPASTGRDLTNPELSTFLTLLTAPHLILALALALLAAERYCRAWSRHGPPPGRVRPRPEALAATALVGALGVVNPFALVPLCAVIGVHAAVMWLRRDGRPARWGLAAAAGMLAVAAPFVVYSALTFTRDPFWGATYGGQNVLPSPPPAEMLVSLGLTLPLALAAGPAFARGGGVARLLVLIWIACTAALMYLPLGTQRRFAFGLQPMLALVAAFALRDWWRVIRGPLPMVGTRLRPMLMFALAQALFGSAAVLYVTAWSIAAEPTRWTTLFAPTARDSAVYQPVELREAADWLAARMEPDDVVLGTVLTGNYLAGIVPGRVYVGHWVATLDYEAKRDAGYWFFSSPFDQQRARFLADHGIRFVVYGPHERALATGGEPDDADGLVLVYAAPDVSIYATAPSTPSPGGER